MIQKLVEFAEEMAREDSASVATLQRRAGKLRFTRTAIMERFGRAALRPSYDLIANQGGVLLQRVKDCRRRRELALATVAPRLITSLRNASPAGPVRIYSDATGAGRLASIGSFSREEGRRPVLQVVKGGQKLLASAATTKKIYIYELFAAIATVFRLRDRLWGG